MPIDDDFTHADRLLAEALDLPTSERAAFLDRRCAENPGVRSLVERLLRRAEEPTVDGDPLEVDGAIPDLSGSTLDRYRLTRQIGRGGMGVVYEAQDERLGRSVAVKVLAVSSVDNRTRERFLHEARAAAALNHPNIVAVHDAGEAAGQPYLVMELAEGRGLDELAPPDVDRAMVLAAKICDALGHAHDRGIVHRDLKPANVLMVGGVAEIKLTDLGIALTRGASRVTRTGTITGTPAYMAPEQALGQEVDGRADLYSLGVMLYEWVAGRPPFDGDDALAVVSQHIHAPVVPPRTFRPDLPRGLEPLILRLLEKNPDERFASAAEVQTALSSVGTDAAPAAAGAAVAIEGLARGRLVGRRAELDRLQSLWRDALEGRGHLGLISGEPGIGKTRLAREITSSARLDGAHVLSGGCYENEATSPYLPFLEALRRFVRQRDDDALRAILGDTAPELARLAPEIESRLGPFAPRAALGPQEERLRLFDHVSRFLSLLAADRGVLFFLDDLQWADHGSLALLYYLLRQLGGERLLFLGTYREVELDRTHALSKALVDWDRERLATRIRLERLGHHETGRMIATLLGQTSPSDEFIRSLHMETEGNPFFLEEIIKTLVADGGLVHDSAGWHRSDPGEVALPQSVKAAIGSRLERVSPTCNEALRTAAVLGKVFEFDELLSVARTGEDDLLDALDEAVDAQLLIAGSGETFSFTHDKIREVLYDELNPIRRRRLHAKIAEGLEALFGKNADVTVEELAHHFIESGNYDKGLRYAGEAADAASSVFAYDEALEMLSQARECAEALLRTEEIHCTDILRIDEAMGDAALARGDVGEASRHYERALASADDPVRRNALRGKVGEAYVISGDRRGLEHVERALDELDLSLHPRETAVAMMIAARYRHLAGDLEAAVTSYRPAVGLAEELGDAELLCRILSFLSGSLQHLARFEESDAVAERCVEIGEQSNHPVGKLLGYEFLSENALFRGWWERSVHYGETEEALAKEVHAGERYGWAHLRTIPLVSMGRLAEAREVFDRGLRECRRSGDRRLEFFLRLSRAEWMEATGNADEARAETLAVVKEVDAAELLAHRIVARGYAVLVLLSNGDAEAAADAARTAVELWRNSGAKGSALIHGADFAEGLVAAAALDEARQVLTWHRKLADDADSDHRRAQNLRVEGLLAEADGRPDDAVSLLDRAIVGFEKCSSGLPLLRGLRDRIRLREASGDREGAATDRLHLRRLAESCGATSF